MSGRSCSTVFGVNAFATSRRNRVWSGGSSPSIDVVRRWKSENRARHSASVIPYCSHTATPAPLPNRGSRRTHWQSSKRETTTKPMLDR